jgi:uncharacterized protein
MKRIPVGTQTFGDILSERMGRRAMLRGTLAVTAMAAMLPACTTAQAPQQPAAAPPVPAAPTPRFSFAEISHGADERHHVSEGYNADILIRWGDPLVKGAKEFRPGQQTPDEQELQFGYNNDYLGFIPFGNDPNRALLCANHEYTIAPMMFPGLMNSAGTVDLKKFTPDTIGVEMAATGCSAMEIRRSAAGKWSVVEGSGYNRRFSARSTVFEASGPAAGHARLRTKADPSGTRIVGTMNNCAGGVTPWGTYLSGEENVDNYFSGLRADHPEYENYHRLGIDLRSRFYAWDMFVDRFNVTKEPNEANRFGWVVEIDPTDPTSTPKKRTALGRFKHEGAESIVNKDGRVVLYMGDDERFEFLYRFVTKGKFNPANPAANRDLLDEGTLSVARFAADGTLAWLDLVHGQGPLTSANRFNSQADVVIEARRAASLLGATPMDRPEDVQPNPKTNKVYVMLTNNAWRGDPARKAGSVGWSSADGAANPRNENSFGHIVELTPPDGDHGASSMRWDMLVQCGDPSVPEFGARWNPQTSENGWFASPDNCAIDAQGRLWVATDQGSNWLETGTADGLWSLETEGPLRGTGRMFFRCPIGAELCGPMFTPDSRTLFVSVQHPGVDGLAEWGNFRRQPTFDDPGTRWPDFQDGVPPRPSVVAITRQDGGAIGG